MNFKEIKIFVNNLAEVNMLDLIKTAISDFRQEIFYSYIEISIEKNLYVRSINCRVELIVSNKCSTCSLTLMSSFCNNLLG